MLDLNIRVFLTRALHSTPMAISLIADSGTGTGQSGKASMSTLLSEGNLPIATMAISLTAD